MESVLLYGSTSWIQTAAMKKRIDGTYTRMLRAVTNTSWKDHVTNQQLYGNFQKTSEIFQTQRLRFAGRCWRNKKELSSDLLFWYPKHGKISRGRSAITFIDQLLTETRLKSIDELKSMMDERDVWRTMVMEHRASSTW